MLDRVKLLKEFDLMRHVLFAQQHDGAESVKRLWQLLCADEANQKSLQSTFAQAGAPTWQGAISGSFPIETNIFDYAVISVDGSQIYPDRHQGTSSYLINIGIVNLVYQAHSPGKAHMKSLPFVCSPLECDDDTSVDHINAKRQEYEFKLGYEYAYECQKTYPEKCMVFLFDGSYIFWHLQSKEHEFKMHYAHAYLAILEQFYQAKIPMAGYISMPKNKELLKVLALYGNMIEKYDYTTEILAYTDEIIINEYLAHYYHSIVFYDHAPIVDVYPVYLKPCFVYINTPYEIGRIEIPQWVVEDKDMLQRVVSVVKDQIDKGKGYPICIAESHEQAVIQGPDRDFFYHTMQKMGSEHRQFLITSRKALKKKYKGF